MSEAAENTVDSAVNGGDAAALRIDPERFPDDKDEVAAAHGMGAVYTHTHDGRRLRREDWSEEQNLAVYGRESLPHGHGHNYVLEVTVGGEVDTQTGMVAPLAELDRHVREVVEMLVRGKSI